MKSELITMKSRDQLHISFGIDRSNDIDPNDEEKSGTEADDRRRYRLDCYQLESSPRSPIRVFTHTQNFTNGIAV